jgi:hypothetical protein
MGGVSSMETHMKKVALIAVLVGLALGGCSSFDNSAPKGVPDSKLLASHNAQADALLSAHSFTNPVSPCGTCGMGNYHW